MQPMHELKSVFSIKYPLVVNIPYVPFVFKRLCWTIHQGVVIYTTLAMPCDNVNYCIETKFNI